MSVIGQIWVELLANTARFRTDLAQARSSAETFGRDVQKSFDRVGGGITGLVGSVTALRTSLVGLAVGGLAFAVKEALNFADELDEMSQRTGVGVESLQELQHAARITGADVESLERGMRTLSKTLGDAAAGSGTAQDKLRGIGLSAVGSSGNLKTLDESLGDVADQIQAATSQTEKIRIATEAFGERIGTKLIPMLMNGREGLDALRKAARDLGVVLDEDVIKHASESADKLKALAEVIKVQLVSALIDLQEPLLAVVGLLAKGAKATKDFWDAMKDWLTDPSLTAGAAEIARRIEKLNENIARGLGELLQMETGTAPGDYLNRAFGNPERLRDRINAMIAERDRLEETLQGKQPAEPPPPGKPPLVFSDKQRQEYVAAELKRLDEEERITKEAGDARNHYYETLYADEVARKQAALDAEVALEEESNQQTKEAGDARNQFYLAEYQTELDERAAFNAAWVAQIDAQLEAEERQLTDEAKIMDDRKALHEQQAVDLAKGFDFVNSAISRSVSAVIAGTKTLDQAFADLGQSIVLSFVEKVINEGLNRLALEFSRFVVDTIAKKRALDAAMGVTSGVGSTVVAGGVGSDVSNIDFALGGFSGGVENAPHLQHGGVTTRGGLAVLHPAEVVAPLNEVGGLGGAQVHIVVNNQAPGVEVVPGPKRMTDGRIYQELIIKTVDRAMANGSFDRSGGSRYGWSTRV